MGVLSLCALDRSCLQIGFPSPVFIFQVSVRHFVKHLRKTSHLGNNLYHGGYDHIDEDGVVRLSCRHSFGQFGAESEERDAFSLAASFGVFCHIL